MKNGGSFHSYVKLPEGILIHQQSYSNVVHRWSSSAVPTRSERNEARETRRQALEQRMRDEQMLKARKFIMDMNIIEYLYNIIYDIVIYGDIYIYIMYK